MTYKDEFTKNLTDYKIVYILCVMISQFSAKTALQFYTHFIDSPSENSTFLNLKKNSARPGAQNTYLGEKPQKTF